VEQEGQAAAEEQAAAEGQAEVEGQAEAEGLELQEAVATLHHARMLPRQEAD
jgi:hypothetical protein